MDPASASSQALQDTDDYLFFDPKTSRARPGAGAAGVAGGGAAGAAGTGGTGGGRNQFSEGIVFVVGGGGYVEYGNLMDWANRSGGGARDGAGGAGGGGGGGAGGGSGGQGVSGQGGRRVTYGSTEILNPERFLKSLEELGSV